MESRVSINVAALGGVKQLRQPVEAWKFEVGAVVRVSIGSDNTRWDRAHADAFNYLSGQVEALSDFTDDSGGKYLVRFFHPPKKPWRQQDDELVQVFWFDAAELVASRADY